MDATESSLRHFSSARRFFIDNGSPSKSLLRDLERVVELAEDERHLTALELLEGVERRIQQREATAADETAQPPKTSTLFGMRPVEPIQVVNSELSMAKQVLQDKKDVFRKLKVSRGCSRHDRRGQQC